ncbi:MAG: hypothetical protein HZB52_06700 [Chloroflexi bacterium]|nr:hypothetical protein [Chloroflexota bacterium]
MSTSFHRPVLRLLSVFILLTLIFAQPKRAEACICPFPVSPEIEFSRVDVVFAGSVINSNDVYSGNPNGNPALGTIEQWRRNFTNNFDDYYDFWVSESWKGVKTTSVTLFTGGTSCGSRFSAGTKYLIYGHYEKGQLIAHVCSRTRTFSSATDDLNYLDTLPKLALAPTLSPALISYILCAASILTPLAILLFKRLRSSPKENSSP